MEEHHHHECQMASGRAPGIISTELRHHMPFTALGALSGIVIMAVFVLAKIPKGPSTVIFETLHPLHVLMSAIVSTAMFRRSARAWWRPSRSAWEARSPSAR